MNVFEENRNMKLLILTQKVDANDHGVLGFFHGWLKEFAKDCENVIVVCLEKGEFDLPENVKVLSLGKETWESKIKYLYRFYKYIIKYRKDYDAVFVHMNQIYVILGALLWKAWKKKIGLWYAHGATPFSLKVAEKLTDMIFTPSKKSFRVKSKKLNVVGHGIDMNKYQLKSHNKKSELCEILTVGRISPIKDYETLIRAMEKLSKKERYKHKIILRIVGSPITEEQKKYFDKIKKKVREKGLSDIIKFTGGVSCKDIHSVYKESDIFIHMSQTGSLDKAMLEAMATGLTVLSCNDAAREVFGENNCDLLYNMADYEDLAEKMQYIIDNQDRDGDLGESLRQIVEKKHNLINVIRRICTKLS
ncbi:MAG: glycosyltransferase [Candidatus Magasanikbacteria bacterium]|nr:glycosyltransferase [Candidatus Magasanikbacteria bacterium]